MISPVDVPCNPAGSRFYFQLIKIVINVQQLRDAEELQTDCTDHLRNECVNGENAGNLTNSFEMDN